jgi:SNF2 family DNA or RNA helicase
VTIFHPKGPKRFAHQKRGLKKLIETGGVCALLFDPGLGKTATVLDYASILALKSRTGEARVLVVAPLAAVDTWVLQADTYVHNDVNIWAEVLGGSIRQRAAALAARGGQPVRTSPDRGPKDTWQGPRAAYWHKAWARSIRGGSGLAVEGPDGLGTNKPRLLIQVINIDTLASRQAVCRCHWESKCPDKRKRTMTLADAVVEGIRRYSPDMVVVDESHKIKSVTGNASRVMARVTDFVKRRVLLTGTVMPHGPLDVFAQWRFMAPYAFGDTLPDGTVKKATYGNFKPRYARLGGWMGKEVIGYQNLDEMQRIMSQNAVVARKEDALDLPPTTPITVPVHLTATEKRAYKDLTDNLYVDLPSGRVVVDNWLTQAMRLRQITSGHMPDDTGTIQVLGQSKVNTIRSLVQDTLTSEKRIVIFCNFTEEIRLLRGALESMKGDAAAEVMVITGATPVAERLRMRQRFGVQPEDDPTRMVIVAQIKTISLSVNELVSANHAIFGSLSQQRDDLIQAQDRLNRIGQTRPVTFWFCLAPGTVDEVIMKSHRDRTSLEAAMLDHIKQVHEFGLDNETDQNGLVGMAVHDALGMAGFL